VSKKYAIQVILAISQWCPVEAARTPGGSPLVDGPVLGIANRSAGYGGWSAGSCGTLEARELLGPFSI
jgi:hypothetical protein